MATAHPTAEDIQFVKEMAERGAHAPLLSGRFMVWWGLLLCLAYTAHHFALGGSFGTDGRVFPLLWIGFVVLGAIGQAILVRSVRAKAGAGSAGNQASRAVWVAGACAIASMAVGAAVAASRGAGPATFDWIVPVAFAVYACALFVTGSLARNLVTKSAGAGSVLMVGLFTALSLSEGSYLVAAGGVAVTVLLPGILLLRAEPR